jgi:hypothetical protein
LINSISVWCTGILWIIWVAKVEDGIESDGEGTPEKASEEEGLRGWMERGRKMVSDWS